MPQPPAPVKIGPFVLGMDTRRPATEMLDRDRNMNAGWYLRSAVNVDIDHLGHLRRRQGAARAVAATQACHSLWAPAGADFGLYVDGTSLMCADAALRTTLLRAGLAPRRRVSYAQLDGRIYYSNGTDAGCVDGAVERPWGLPLPSQHPTFTALPDAGLLPDGTYRGYCVFVSADGQESGASEVASVTLAATPRAPAAGGNRSADVGGSALRVTGLPTALPEGASHVALYLTTPGGEVFMHALNTVEPTVDIVSMPPLGALGRTLGLAPLPPGQIVRAHGGRLLVAAGDVLWFSRPFEPALHDPLRDFVQFDAPITLVVPCGSGVYVCADKTYWLDGDIAAAEPKEVLPYGGVPHSDAESPDEDAVWWQSPRGLVRGSANGQAENQQEAHVAVGAAAAGATLFTARDGRKQAISSLFSARGSGLAARSYMDAEVIRKGTVL